MIKSALIISPKASGTTGFDEKKSSQVKKSSQGEKLRSSIHLSLPKETKTNFMVAQ